MAHALVILANGFEEIEAVTIIDVLRRAKIKVTVAGLDQGLAQGSHGIAIQVDTLLDAPSPEAFDALLLPGGMPGAARLRDDPRVQAAISRFFRAGKLIGAICAAPIALERVGILVGKRATSYPGFALPSAEYVEEAVVDAGQIITSRGPGTALPFALKLVERLAGHALAVELRKGMLVSGV